MVYGGLHILQALRDQGEQFPLCRILAHASHQVHPPGGPTRQIRLWRSRREPSPKPTTFAARNRDPGRVHRLVIPRSVSIFALQVWPKGILKSSNRLLDGLVKLIIVVTIAVEDEIDLLFFFVGELQLLFLRAEVPTHRKPQS